MRNNTFLNLLLELYPDSDWNVSKIMYGRSDKFKNTNDGYYNFDSDKNICIPISIINYQVNQPDFHYLLNNSDCSSITSLDWNFLRIVEHPNLNIDLFLKLLLDNQKFLKFILDSNIYLTFENILERISQRRNLSLDIIEKYSFWDWGLLSSNLNLNERFLRQHSEQLWDVDKLSENSRFDISWIEVFPSYSWRWDYISKNKNLRLEWILSYPSKDWELSYITQSRYFNLSWLKILCNLGIDHLDIHQVCWEKCCNFKIEWVKNITDYNWSFFKLSHHPSFEFSWIDEYPSEQWDWHSLSLNTKLTLDRLKKYSHKWSSISNLVMNNSFDIKWVESFPSWNWSFYYISSIKNVSLDWLKSLPDYSWDYKEILLKSNLNEDLISYIISKCRIRYWSFISRNKSFNINWVSSSNYQLCDWYHGISNQRSLTIEWIKKYPEAKWNLDKVIQNQNIVIEDFPIIMKLFNMKINDFSLNPNLTIEYIQDNKEKLDFKKMSLNSFNGIYHQNYRQIQLKREQLEIYGQELIEKTWHPLRFIDWCLDLDSQKEIH